MSFVFMWGGVGSILCAKHSKILIVAPQIDYEGLMSPFSLFLTAWWSEVSPRAFRSCVGKALREVLDSQGHIQNPRAGIGTLGPLCCFAELEHCQRK